MKFKELAKTIWKWFAGPASEPAPAAAAENIAPPVGDMAVIADTPAEDTVTLSSRAARRLRNKMRPDRARRPWRHCIPAAHRRHADRTARRAS